MWLVAENSPNARALARGDKLLIYGPPHEGRNCVLGRFTLQTAPVRRVRRFKGLLHELGRYFSLWAEISDAMLWEKPLPIAELVPELGIFETEELAALYLRPPGLQQLSKGDFHRIVEAGGKC